MLLQRFGKEYRITEDEVKRLLGEKCFRLKRESKRFEKAVRPRCQWRSGCCVGIFLESWHKRERHYCVITQSCHKVANEMIRIALRTSPAIALEVFKSGG